MRILLWCRWEWEKTQKEKGFVVASVLLPLALSALDWGGTSLDRRFEYEPRVRHCVIRASFVFSDLFASTVFGLISYETLVLLNLVAVVLCQNRRCTSRRQRCSCRSDGRLLRIYSPRAPHFRGIILCH
ncbi:hypothetical protein QR680_009644 [Steinernema hermaphroditum]|uniref:Uncharacterized protein n=1 Tax=Steinernema hermaphroditum TaxID=289476 RepID=A0AA39MA46_9BILA|nr:hypothetical protein QR680_009644 [Steinernema hermaphroditum]